MKLRDVKMVDKIRQFEMTTQNILYVRYIVAKAMWTVCVIESGYLKSYNGTWGEMNYIYNRTRGNEGYILAATVYDDVERIEIIVWPAYVNVYIGGGTWMKSITR